jgi:hypothetical protein
LSGGQVVDLTPFFLVAMHYYGELMSGRLENKIAEKQSVLAEI